MTGVVAWNAAEAELVIAPFISQEGGLLPALHALQDRFGFVPREAVTLLASAFNLSRADVHGTISFYHDFRREPPGRHVVRLCRAEACQSRGGERVADEIRSRLGVEFGGTDPAGRVSLEPAFCLGLCAVAPAALIDGAPVGRIDAERVAVAIEGAAG